MDGWITLNLDGMERSVRRDLWRIWLVPGPPEPEVQVRVQVDPGSPLRWEELDRLPELVEIHYEGRDAGVQGYLDARPQITRFHWSGHRQSRVDFSGTRLTELSLSCQGPLEVHLPAQGTLRQLSLEAPVDPEWLRVTVPGSGAGIDLRMGRRGLAGPSAVPGLERVGSLSLSRVREVRLERLLPYRHLERLSVSGPPGAIPDFELLARFPALREVCLRECYELDLDRLPTASAFPALERVEVDGIRQEDAARLVERLAGVKLSIRGKRSAAWIRVNMDNPFKDWTEEHGRRIGAAAMAAYRKADVALDAAAPDPAVVRAILHTFVQTFNHLSDRHPLDTIHREQFGEAFDSLSERVSTLIPVETAHDWFAEWDET